MAVRSAQTLNPRESRIAVKALRSSADAMTLERLARVLAGTTAHEVDDSCVNTLTLSQVTATVLTFSEPQTAACVAGTVTLTHH